MSSLQALDSIKMTSKTVRDAAIELNKLASITRRLTLCWIKAHVGHPGNEIADQLAKRATEFIHLQEVPIATSQIKATLKSKFYEWWRSDWEKESTCRQTKQFHPIPDSNMCKNLTKLARSQLSLYIKIVTGHNNLAYHAAKLDPSINPQCSLCEEEAETFHHFITNCPCLWQSRRDVGIDENDSKTWTPERLLEFARIPAIEALLNRF